MAISLVIWTCDELIFTNSACKIEPQQHTSCMFAASWLCRDLLLYQYRSFLHVRQQYWNKIHLQSQLFCQPPLNIKYFPCHFFFSKNLKENMTLGVECFCWTFNNWPPRTKNYFAPEFNFRWGKKVMKFTCTVQETAKIPNIIFIKTCWVTVRCAQAMLQKILFNMLVKQIKSKIKNLLKRYRTSK